LLTNRHTDTSTDNKGRLKHAAREAIITKHHGQTVALADLYDTVYILTTCTYGLCQCITNATWN